MASILKVDQIVENTSGVGTNFSNTGSASTPTISIGNQTNKGFYHEGTNKIGVSVGGNKVGEIGVGYGGFTGNVIQVVNSENQYSHSITNNANWNSDLLLNVGVPWEIVVTPKHSNSKIEIQLLQNGSVGSSSNGSYFGISIWRKIGLGAYSQIQVPHTDNNGSVEFGLYSTISAGTITSLGMYSNYSKLYIDSPNSTDTITYKFSVRTYSVSTFSANINGSLNKSKSYCILKEIQQ